MLVIQILNSSPDFRFGDRHRQTVDLDCKLYIAYTW
jgi:hypothetical protein